MIRSVLPDRAEARWMLLGVLLSALGRGLTLPFLFVYLHDVRGIGTATVGYAVAWVGLTGLVMTPVAGTLIDRLGARWVMITALLLCSAGTVALTRAHTAWQAIGALTAFAIGIPAMWAGLTTILATLTREEERQRVFGLQFTLLNLGIGVGSLVSAMVVDVHRPNTFVLIYLLDAATFLAPVTILLALPRVGRRIAGTEPTATAEPAAGAETAVEPGAERDSYRIVFRDRAFVRALLAGLVLVSCGYAQFEIGYVAYATQIAELSTRVLGLSFAVNTVTIVLAQLYVLRWLDGRSRSRALALVGWVWAVAWSLVGMAGLVRGESYLGAAAVAVAAVGVVFALGETLWSPVMPALTNALAPARLRGRYNALGSMLWGVSGVIGPMVSGFLIGGGRIGLWFGLIIGGCLVGSLLALSLRRMLTPAQDGRPAPKPAPLEVDQGLYDATRRA